MGAGTNSRASPDHTVDDARLGIHLGSCVHGIVAVTTRAIDYIQIAATICLGTPSIEPVVLGGPGIQRTPLHKLWKCRALDREWCITWQEVEHCWLEHIGAGIDMKTCGGARGGFFYEASHFAMCITLDDPELCRVSNGREMNGCQRTSLHVATMSGDQICD